MLDELLKCATEAALIAGKIIKEGFGTSFTIKNKEGKNNLVTEYDNLSEEAIINKITSRFPDHKFLAEESGKSGFQNSDNIRWLIDPLDGTVNFAHQLPIFSVSIAAELNKELLVGVIYNPILDELFYAKKGGGAFLNNEPIKVSETTSLDTSFLVTGFPYNVDKDPGFCVEQFISIIRRGIPIRRLGSAALDLAYVANGRFDGFWEIELKPWDVAAGVLLVREAGGLVTQYNNEPYWIDDLSMLATNGKIHDEISATLQSCYMELSNGY